MPVTSVGPSSAASPGHGTIRLRGSGAAPAAAAPPPLAAAPAGPVGHGTTRLMARPPAYAVNAPFIPGVPPPKGETAGANKGRISIR